MEGELVKVDPEVFDVENKEWRRCFKACVTQAKQSTLDLDEGQCAENCLYKYVQARIFLAQKLQHDLTKAMGDPRMRKGH